MGDEDYLDETMCAVKKKLMLKSHLRHSVRFGCECLQRIQIDVVNRHYRKLSRYSGLLVVTRFRDSYPAPND